MVRLTVLEGGTSILTRILLSDRELSSEDLVARDAVEEAPGMPS